MGSCTRRKRRCVRTEEWLQSSAHTERHWLLRRRLEGRRLCGLLFVVVVGRRPAVHHTSWLHRAQDTPWRPAESELPAEAVRVATTALTAARSDAHGLLATPTSFEVFVFEWVEHAHGFAVARVHGGDEWLDTLLETEDTPPDVQPTLVQVVRDTATLVSHWIRRDDQMDDLPSFKPLPCLSE